MKRLSLWLTILFLSACGGGATSSESQQIPGGDPSRGRQAIQDYGCGACHIVPGVPGATATVGPPLTAWADRRYIAGALPNSPENLIAWIRDPQAIEPGTVMPTLGVTESDARDVAAYLMTLK
jgi:cytochrome c1